MAEKDRSLSDHRDDKSANHQAHLQADRLVLPQRPLTLDGHAVLDAQPALFLLAEAAIDRFMRLDRLAAGLAPHRDVARDLSVLPDRRGIGQHPVVVAVLAAVLDVAGPRAAFLQRPPQILEGLHRHVRMAHQVVRLADQFRFGKAADVQEILVDVVDAALHVGLGYDQARVRQLDFVLGHRQVGSHWSVS